MDTPHANPRQIERHELDELITAAEAEHGPISEEGVQDKRDILRWEREH